MVRRLPQQRLRQRRISQLPRLRREHLLLLERAMPPVRLLLMPEPELAAAQPSAPQPWPRFAPFCRTRLLRNSVAFVAKEGM